VSITQVVGFFTTNPTKLGLHFSDFSTIFYEIYKIQHFTTTIGDEVLHRGPWKEGKPYNVAPGVRWPARPAKFRQAPVMGSAGDHAGRDYGWLGIDWNRSWELRWPVAERAAAPNGGIRSGLSSGMGCGEGVRLEAVVVRVGASEGPECIVRW
jgi:hypothetical protein